MKLLLIRHGETKLNVARVLQPAATALSERGQAQAAALAQRLASAGLAGIVSSSLPRAVQTADHLAQATGLPVMTTDLLHERNFGDWRGLGYDSLDRDPQKMVEAPPGGESVRQFEQRVAAAFDHVMSLQAAVDGPLAVVTHGLVLKTMLMQQVSPPDGQPWPIAMRNCSLSILRVAAPFVIELLDCTEHLDADLADRPHSLSGG